MESLMSIRKFPLTQESLGPIFSPMKPTLRQLVVDCDLRQNWLASRLGVSESLVSKWLSGSLGLPMRRVRPLAVELGVSVDKVLAAAERTLKERKIS